MKKVYSSNIMCGGCKSTVSTVLDHHEGVNNWEVDLESENKHITIDIDPQYEEEILKKLDDLGYQLKSA